METISILLNRIEIGGVAVDYQVMFNFAVAGMFTLGGWVLGRITKTLDQLDSDVRIMPEKYVLKADYIDTLKGLHDKLDKIVEKIDKKMDKGR